MPMDRLFRHCIAVCVLVFVNLGNCSMAAAVQHHAHAATSPSWIAFATAAVLLFTFIFW